MIPCGKLKLVGKEEYKHQVCAQGLSWKGALLFDVGDSGKVLGGLIVNSCIKHKVIKTKEKTHPQHGGWISL